MISAKNIVKAYAGHKALDGLDAEIPSGKITGLLGPNGAGKTTFIRILNNIILPDSGTITFQDKPLTADHISQVGYLPEERGLYRKMRVKEQLLYLAKLRGVQVKDAERQIAEWLKKLDLTSWEHVNVEKLSKGMQQKVQFIASVLHDPDFIILDEPFTGFDPVNAEVIRKEIIELKEKGKTILLSTHRMESVESLCDHIVLIHHAKNVLTGSVDALKQQFKEDVFEFKGKYLPDHPHEGIFPDHSHEGKLLEAGEGKYHYKVKLTPEEIQPMIDLLNKQTQLRSVQEVLPSMHDVFFKVIGKDA